MTGKLERHVEEAEQSTGSLVREQRNAVSQVVPVRTQGQQPQQQPGQPGQSQAQRLDSSTQAAVDSTRGLSADSTRVRGFLEAMMPRIRAARAEEFYDAATAGHEAPATIFTSPADAEARHSQDILGVARQAITENARSSGQPEPALPVQVRSDEELAGAQKALDGYSAAIAQSWFTRDVLGDVVYGRFNRTPPVATAEDESYFSALVMAYGGVNPGIYYGDTNHVIMGAYQLEWDEARIMHLLVHEELHYAAFLGGGRDVRWRDENGAPVMRRRGYWNVNEGMTELLAQQLCMEHGMAQSTVGYPYETAVSFVMEQVVGQEPMRRAFFSGDFTEVRQLLDARLGAGTFDALMSTQVNAEAFSLIMQKAGAAGMDTASWESNPIMAHCFSQISEIRQQ